MFLVWTSSQIFQGPGSPVSVYFWMDASVPCKTSWCLWSSMERCALPHVKIFLTLEVHNILVCLRSHVRCFKSMAVGLLFATCSVLQVHGILVCLDWTFDASSAQKFGVLVTICMNCRYETRILAYFMHESIRRRKLHVSVSCHVTMYATVTSSTDVLRHRS